MYTSRVQQEVPYFSYRLAQLQYTLSKYYHSDLHQSSRYKVCKEYDSTAMIRLVAVEVHNRMGLGS